MFVNSFPKVGVLAPDNDNFGFYRKSLQNNIFGGKCCSLTMYGEFDSYKGLVRHQEKSFTCRGIILNRFSTVVEIHRTRGAKLRRFTKKNVFFECASVVGDGAKIILRAYFPGRWHQKKCPTDR